jgi:hypothetical protein
MESGMSHITGPIAKSYRQAMKLIFIHGAPASGKLTVAQALLRAVPGRLFDNHAAIDLALTIFDFDSPGFWELVHVVRLSALEAAAEHGVPLVATTYCYSEPEDSAVFEQFEGILKRHSGELLPVFLYCSEEESARRVSSADRVERKKIASVEALNSFRTRWNIVPVPRSNCLTLDTEGRSPDATAHEIIRHFALVQNS